MADSYVALLKGARFWLSGSIQDAADGPDSESIRAFIAKLSERIFHDRGSIIHGSHSTIWSILLQ